MFNQLICIGNLTKEPELRYLPSGSAVFNNTVATSHKYKTQSGEQKDETAFIDFVIFGKGAEIANQYLHKGSKVFLEGRLKQESWEKEGQKHTKLVLQVETMKMLDGKKDGDSTQQKPQSRQPQQVQQNYVPEYEINEENIPF